MKRTADANDRELIRAAIGAINAVYSPENIYHTVGAALRCKNGRVYTGVNCDGIHGSCAEFIAMGAAKVAGEREFDCIVAVASAEKGNRILPPCGNCRQMLYEYCPDVDVIVPEADGSPVKLGILDLLPYPYHE